MKDLLQNKVYLTLTAIMAFILSTFTYVMSDGSSIWMNILRFVISYAVLFIVLLVVVEILMKNGIELKDTKVNRRKILFYAVPAMIIWGLYLVALYPGCMTFDSFFQISQIKKTHIYNDWHPVSHTLLIQFLRLFWDSPASLAAFQIVAMALVFGYTMYSLERNGVAAKYLNIAMVLISITPVNGLMAVTLWKDILFSVALLWFTAIMINVVLSKGNFFDKKGNNAIFIIASLGILLFRHNGKYALIPTILIMMFLYRNKIRQIIISFSVIIITYLLVVIPIFGVLKVVPATDGEAFSVPLNVTGSVISYGGVLTEEEKVYASSIIPIEQWKNTYVSFTADPLKNAVQKNSQIILKDKVKFLKFVAQISIRNPRAAFKGYFNLAGIAWRIPTVVGSGTTIPNLKIPENEFKITNYSINTKLTATVHKVVEASSSRRLVWLFWRPALPLFLVLLLSGVSVVRNGVREGIKSILIPAAIIFNTLGVMLAIPAQDYRYFFSTALIALPVFLFSFIKYTKDV